MALHGLIFRHIFNDGRNGEQEDKGDEEHRRPGHVGGDEPRGQRTNEQAGLEGSGGKAEVGLLIILTQVLGHVDDIERLSGGQTGGLNQTPSQHHGPRTRENESQDGTHGHKPDTGKHELPNRDGVRQGGVDDGADTNDDAGQRGLQRSGFIGDLQRFRDRHGHRLESIVNDEGEDEDEKEDRDGRLGVNLGAIPRHGLNFFQHGSCPLWEEELSRLR